MPLARTTEGYPRVLVQARAPVAVPDRRDPVARTRDNLSKTTALPPSNPRLPSSRQRGRRRWRKRTWLQWRHCRHGDRLSASAWTRRQERSDALKASRRYQAGGGASGCQSCSRFQCGFARSAQRRFLRARKAHPVSVQTRLAERRAQCEGVGCGALPDCRDRVRGAVDACRGGAASWTIAPVPTPNVSVPLTATLSPGCRRVSIRCGRVSYFDSNAPCGHAGGAWNGSSWFAAHDAEAAGCNP